MKAKGEFKDPDTTSEELKKQMLNDFLMKHKDRAVDPKKGPPVAWDDKTQEWVWLSRKARRKSGFNY